MSRHRSKTITTVAALLGGSLGAHRFYLHGWRDSWAWVHVGCTLGGVLGLLMLRASALSSATGWVLALTGWASWVAALLTAIVFGLRPDEKWDARYNPGSGQVSRSGWAVVLAVIVSLMIGAALLMSGLAFSFEKFFESQIEAARRISQGE